MQGPDLPQARRLLRLSALLYFYRRRLRVHAVQELLAGLGVATAVALVFATMVASGSIAGSAGEVVHAVSGPATLQIHSRSSDGFPEGLLARAARLPAVMHAAPLLEQTATIAVAHGRRVNVDLAGADRRLATLDGLVHTLPVAALSSGGIGLSDTSAGRLGIARPPAGTSPADDVLLTVRGHTYPLKVSAVLGAEAFGALAQANVAIMPLTRLQRLAGLRGRITRILVQPKPGQEAAARAQLQRLAGGRLDVTAATADVGLLRQALRPSDQASGFFATISALLGLLFAFNALLLTVPERRRAIADLRLIGARRSAIAQMFAFQALCLGVLAALAGLAAGLALSLDQYPLYLAEAFTLGNRAVVGSRPLLFAFIGGVLVTCLASAVPLWGLRHKAALDAVRRETGVPGDALGPKARRALALAAAALLAGTTLLLLVAPSLALLACTMLALATVLAVPLVLAGVLRVARSISEHRQTLTVLPVALTWLRATSVRSLALAATGAVALFGSIALGGARGDLIHGVRQAAHSYASDASIWVGSPDDNQAVVDFRPGNLAQRIAAVRGVIGVHTFQGGFMQLGGRRVWIVARPPGGARHVLASQVSRTRAPTAIRRVEAGGWIALSKQLAEQHRVSVGGTLTLPTPSGGIPLKVAATTTDLAWSPGVIFMSTADYTRLWATSLPTALGVDLAPGASTASAQRAIERLLGATSGLEVLSAQEREHSIDALTSEGLAQIGEISTLLLIAAIVAMAAALTSAIWQRRTALAGLRLSGARPQRLRLILLVESALMLGAGCVTGAVAGIYGQVVIDRYLAQVTGFPVASIGASARPLEIFLLVSVIVLAIAAVPGWLASRVSPTLAFSE